NREALRAVIEEVFSRLDAQSVVDRLDRAQIANARLNTMQEFWDHPQLKARDRWRDVETPRGPIKALVPPGTMRDVEPRMDPIPDVGAHTRQILQELGFDESFVSRLQADNAI